MACLYKPGETSHKKALTKQVLSAPGPLGRSASSTPRPSPSPASRPWLKSTVAPLSRAASWSQGPPIRGQGQQREGVGRWAGPRGGMWSTQGRGGGGPRPAPASRAVSRQLRPTPRTRAAPLGARVLLGADDPSLRTQTAGLTSHLEPRSNAAWILT